MKLKPCEQLWAVALYQYSILETLMLIHYNAEYQAHLIQCSNTASSWIDLIISVCTPQSIKCSGSYNIKLIWFNAAKLNPVELIYLIIRVPPKHKMLRIFWFARATSHPEALQQEKICKCLCYLMTNFYMPKVRVKQSRDKSLPKHTEEGGSGVQYR